MQAYLILANGMVFKGRSLGCQGTTVGEVVFATGMVGFEETLTDPSYYGQIITQTYPLIGNYGMNRQDQESDRVWAKGYIVREACTTPSNFRSEETLDTFLKDQGIIGIEGIDTRALTRVLRESGVMNGAITTEFDPEQQQERLSQLMPAIRKYAVTGAVAAVTCTEPQCFAPTAGVAQGEEPLHIALLDLGCKNNIVRCLCKRGCRVTVLPGTTTPAELAALVPEDFDVNTLSVHEFTPLAASNYSADYGDVTATLTFATQYSPMQTLVAMVGVVTGEDEDGNPIVEWTALKAEAVADETGCLRADWNFDGVHLNVKGCQAWLEYLRTHPVGEAPETAEPVEEAGTVEITEEAE